ncbi:MAG: hypothetical protein EFT35_06315 [Methanophagales archaeon ANME-1-THS]|nr:MAG: hypothetical protein EFT35_06315 [Methanophagales archaeon ANME-1-THS]
MKAKNMLVISILIILLLGIGIGIGIANTEVNVGANSQKFSKSDLKELYCKYKVTENDIKFAKGELPHYLTGTILDGNVRVIVSETGAPPEGFKKGEHYDVVIGVDEMFAIIDEACERFIEKYGVDPGNPKLDAVDGVPLPKEEVKKLVKSRKFDSGDAEPSVGILGGPLEGPHAIDGNLYAHVFIAKDTRHKPRELVTGDTSAALSRFETQFGVNMVWYWYFGYWNAGDISPASSCMNALGDLAEDEAWVVDAENDIVIGWLHDMDHNGMAFLDGFYAVCSDTARGVDWSHDSIVQHEVSHLFNAPDHGRAGPNCIMTEWYAYWGKEVWCASCEATVNENIWGGEID